ncbi:carotenoid oxygenase family protein [Sphaerospermopsis sp. FACHB-1094]|uniref:Lignostilbene-alpha,beta-dioxygenase n=1 Tax=Sphaerospermopsis reniformis TaxID=531300 RepID=A0A479ZVC2_9CYAN|nr:MULTISPECIES: carotenoid oxygenase family protein [Sphaerospermopsis]MBD2131309.1 carotenoid oxygenase family protein [Sphaerospermopsis sp. FACHB-1094]GCL35218.1 lignostilbene-alpha,beta-dioxygenase [Sphaerospermopsis reniformis]
MQILEPQNQQTLAKSYNQEDWQKGYESLKQEYDYWIDEIEGVIPAELQGTLLRNGPGLLDINGQRLHHPFDGDGMISRITFTNGRAHFRNKFVETEGYLAEKKAGKILYRGVFGTQKPGGWLANAFDFKIKHIANTNVIYWGKKLLALWEAAEPYLLHPHTLETLGNEYFNGVLSPGEAFSAHPRIDPNGKLVNFAIKPGLSTTITIFELNTNGEIISKQNHSVPGFCFIHDFVITENYCIFFQNPVNFNPIPFALGMASAGQCIQVQKNQPTKIIIIPRKDSKAEKEEVRTLETQAGFIFHHVNAFEVETEIIIDSICYESLPEVEPNTDYLQTNFDTNAPGQIWRFDINLPEKKVQSQLIDKRACEFPTIHPNNVGRPYRYLYIAAAHNPIGNAPLQAIMKVDLATEKREIWSAAPRGFMGEPIFIPRSNSQQEDEGWVIALVYDAEHHRSDVVILDAQDFSKGVIAKLHLKHHIPYGLHGSFTPETFI